MEQAAITTDCRASLRRSTVLFVVQCVVEKKRIYAKNQSDPNKYLRRKPQRWNSSIIRSFNIVSEQTIDGRVVKIHRDWRFTRRRSIRAPLVNVRLTFCIKLRTLWSKPRWCKEAKKNRTIEWYLRLFNIPKDGRRNTWVVTACLCHYVGREK